MKKKIGVIVGIILCLVIAWNLGTTPSQIVVYTPGQLEEAKKSPHSDSVTEKVEQESLKKNPVTQENKANEQVKKEEVNKKVVEQQIKQKEQGKEEENKEKQEVDKKQKEEINTEKSQKIEQQKPVKVEDTQKEKHQTDTSKDTPPASKVVEVTGQELDAAQADKKKADALKQEIIDNQDYSKKDKYMTDPVPEGKPKPVEPQDTTVDKTASFKVKLSVSCGTILNNMKLLNKNKYELVPDDGIIFPLQEVTAYQGESVFDVLLREMQNNKIHMEFVNTPIYNSAYIEGINNLYEFDVGELSGWMYKVNEWFPNYGCSRYQVYEGDVIEWVYTCDLGRDVGDTYYDK